MRPRRKRVVEGPKKHVRLELPDKDHETLKALAKYSGKTIVGYVRGLVLGEVRWFEKGNKPGGSLERKRKRRQPAL